MDRRERQSPSDMQQVAKANGARLFVLVVAARVPLTHDVGQRDEPYRPQLIVHDGDTAGVHLEQDVGDGLDAEIGSRGDDVLPHDGRDVAPRDGPVLATQELAARAPDDPCMVVRTVRRAGLDRRPWFHGVPFLLPRMT